MPSNIVILSSQGSQLTREKHFFHVRICYIFGHWIPCNHCVLLILCKNALKSVITLLLSVFNTWLMHFHALKLSKMFLAKSNWPETSLSCQVKAHNWREKSIFSMSEYVTYSDMLCPNMQHIRTQNSGFRAKNCWKNAKNPLKMLWNVDTVQ